MKFNNLEPEEIDIQTKDFILDVREADEFTVGHLPNAINVPLLDLDNHIDALNKEKNIFVYCRSGIRSLEAVRILQSKGFENIDHLKGGLIAWVNHTKENIQIK